MREAKYKMFYAAGNYWIMSCDSSDEQYMTPIIINETGAVIWKYLSEYNSLKETAQRLSDFYGITIEDAKADISLFTDSLRKYGIKYI